jgi:hypothetical protein
MRARLPLVSLTGAAAALVFVASAGAQTPGLDSVNALGSAPPLDQVNVTAQATPSGQDVTGAATVSLLGFGVVSGPVTCLTVTGPDRGGGTPTAPTTATLNFQDPRGILTARIVDNGGQSAPDEIQVAALGRAATDCSPLPAGVGIDATFDHGRAIVFDAPPLPTSQDQCKNGGWQTYGVFKNQGDCVSFVATKGKNPPAGH